MMPNAPSPEKVAPEDVRRCVTELSGFEWAVAIGDLESPLGPSIVLYRSRFRGARSGTNVVACGRYTGAAIEIHKWFPTRGYPIEETIKADLRVLTAMVRTELQP